MLKRTSNTHPNKYTNNCLVRIFQLIIEFVFNNTLVYLSNQYPLVLDNITYSNKKKCYLILFRFKNSSKTLTIKISEFFKDKDLINLISPINAYFVGIIQGLEANNIVIENCDEISTHFKLFNQFSSVKPLIKITDIQLSNTNEFIIVKTKFSSKYTKIPMLDISKKPFLLQAFENADALYLGMNSLDFFLHSHHAINT